MKDDEALRQVIIRISPGIAVKIFDVFLQSYDWYDTMGRRPQCVLRKETSTEIEYVIFTNGLSVGQEAKWVLVEAATILFKPTIGPGSQTRVQLRRVFAEAVVPILPAEALVDMIDAYGFYATQQIQRSIEQVEDRLRAAEAVRPTNSSINSISEKRGRRGQGGPAEKAAAWLEWHNLPDSERPRLEDWLEQKYGTENGILCVSPRTFHGWKRYIKN